MSSDNLYQNLWLAVEDLELYEFGGIEIPLSPSWQRVCVNFSGGADSALLTLMLCDIISKNNLNTKVDAITFDRFWFSRPWLKPISEMVFHRIKSKFPTILDKQHFSFLAPELEHLRVELENSTETRGAFTMSTYTFNDYHCFYNEDVGAVYHGRSRNSSALLDHPSRVKRRDDPDPEEAYEKLKRSESYILRPLLMVEKDWIVEQLIKNGWKDLFDITRSCGSNLNKITKGWRFKADEPIPECGECYWCAERKWAIDKVV